MRPFPVLNWPRPGDRFILTEEKLPMLAKLLALAEKGTPTWRLGLTAFIGCFVTWSFGAGPTFLGSGFALADEEDKIHHEIRQELSGVKSSVDKLAEAMAQDSERRAELERQNSIRQIRRQIYETERDACAADGQLKALLLTQANQLRADFYGLAKEEYPAVDCSAFR